MLMFIQWSSIKAFLIWSKIKRFFFFCLERCYFYYGHINYLITDLIGDKLYSEEKGNHWIWTFFFDNYQWGMKKSYEIDEKYNFGEWNLPDDEKEKEQ